MEEIYYYIKHAERQINQIERRVLKGETIPHDEKVFSIFQPHIEWINKGKVDVPVELGIRVGIIEAQYQFLLHHRIMQKETDEKVAVIMVQKTKEKFSGMISISYDRAFYSIKKFGRTKKRIRECLVAKKTKII